MPILGNDGASGAVSNIENTIRGGKFVMGPTSGWASSITAHIHTISIMPATARIKYAIYRASDFSLVAETEEREFEISTMGSGPQTCQFPCPVPLLAHEEYILFAWAGSVEGTVSIRFSMSGGLGVYSKPLAYGEWPNPLTGATLLDGDANAFMYCEYSIEG